eukprot:snap_masked-scaffold19_size710362-processed-gene-4.7 protein:Tk00403 transcript:snap_masked-scaffold19_size710362-processed-gene-4.7-mRNA-1 annotation:"mannose-6-phosphate isomerase"
MELLCQTKSYAWGQLGTESEVFNLRRAVDPDSVSIPDDPYAELWMGTHPSGPSILKASGVDLQAHVEAHPELLGTSQAQFGQQLPYLLKVLSVRKALSIQAHPDRPHACQLHEARPEVYPDPNHKPEMAIALTPFQGLCGFRPLVEIQAQIQKAPLSSILGPAVVSGLVQADEVTYPEPLKVAFETLMNAPKDQIKGAFDELRSDLESRAKDSLDETQRLFLTLAEQYPEDVGCFVIFFVNLVKLQPGEAMFLGPNLIHAYLSGDCIECMACSDNVVRSGLTPKLIDTPTLIGMLDYTCKPGADMKFQPARESPWTLVYDPPVPDFAVAKIAVAGDEPVDLPVRPTASILLVIQGSGQYQLAEGPEAFQRGSVHFLGAGQPLQIQRSSNDPITIYQAYC